MTYNPLLCSSSQNRRNTNCRMNLSEYRTTNLRFTAAIALLLVSYFSNTFHAHSFQLTSSRVHKNRCHVDNNCKPVGRTAQSTILRSTAATTATSTPDTRDASFASQWMENEKQIEDRMDDRSSGAATIEKEYDETNLPFGKWEYTDGNYILRPSLDANQQPRALLHFLGGAFLGAAPQLTYRYLLERLATKGYLIVATPYQLSFDHLRSCDEIIGKFERGENDV